METEKAYYEFIGKLAIVLYTQRINLRLSTLHKILNDNGADYGGGIGMRKVFSVAYEFWRKKDSADGGLTHHAIAATFTGQNDEYLFG